MIAKPKRSLVRPIISVLMLTLLVGCRDFMVLDPCNEERVFWSKQPPSKVPETVKKWRNLGLKCTAHGSRGTVTWRCSC